LFRVPKTEFRIEILSALGEPAPPAERAAFTEFEQAATVRAFRAEAQVVLVSAF